jgi:hypothetical protein
MVCKEKAGREMLVPDGMNAMGKKVLEALKNKIMKYMLLVLMIGLSSLVRAQLCLGNDIFNNTVLYSPTWISGCATGTSCSGGMPFTNQSSCDPVDALDPCAVAPSCGIAQNGNDLWFTFYPTDTTAIISVVQNTAFVAGIQAFAPAQGCGNLMEIGCEISVGPSGGVALQLNGLIMGQQYFFRVFGSANNQSQREGIFCFCGTEGLSDGQLPTRVTLHAQPQAESVQLQWTAIEDSRAEYYAVERSTDALHFETIATMEARHTSWAAEYTHQDVNLAPGTQYYRVLAVDLDGTESYSDIVEAQVERQLTFEVAGNPCHENLQVEAREPFQASISDLSGSHRLTHSMTLGSNRVDVHELAAGIYFLKNDSNGDTQRFVVMK